MTEIVGIAILTGIILSLIVIGAGMLLRKGGF